MSLWIRFAQVAAVATMLLLQGRAAQINSVVQVLSTPNPVVQGQNEVFTAGVNFSGAALPSGTITLFDTVRSSSCSVTNLALGSVTLGSASSATPGAGAITVSSFPCLGPNVVVAQYSGDANYNSGISTALVVTVLSKFTPTTATLKSSLNPSAVGDAVTFSAILGYIVNGAYPSGQVTFTDTTTHTILGTGNVQTSGKGAQYTTGAAITTLTLTAGPHAIQATYSGNNIYSGSTSPVINQIVQQTVGGAGAGTATHFSVTAPPTASAGIPVSFTVTALDSMNNTATNFTDPVQFTSTDPSATLPRIVTLTNGKGTFTASLVTIGAQTLTAKDLLTPSIGGTSGSITVSAASGLGFVPINSCRAVDTRDAAGPFGGPFIAAGGSRDFTIPNSACGIPATAQSYSVNVTVLPHHSLFYLTVWPAGQSIPQASTLNALDGRIKANAVIVPAGSNGAISVFTTDDTDLILDINGYFVPAISPSALAFYPVTPCRVVDTRNGTLLSGPFSGGQTSTLPLRSSTCNVPVAAQAYSLNFTAVPSGPFLYLSVWPTGQSQPTASTLNDLPGTIVANAAIVPAGTSGSIDVFASGATDLIVDINGYFAPPATGGLSLYNLPPCRVIDTRNTPGSPFTGQLDVNVIGSGCGGTPTAQAYVLNSSVIPSGELIYLTLWPQGAAQPTVSTLNAIDGAITNNMAIVPTNNTEISAYASGPSATYLILDISGYFAP